MLIARTEDASVAMTCVKMLKLQPKFMFRCKGMDRNINEISVIFYGFRLFKLFCKIS